MIAEKQHLDVYIILVNYGNWKDTIQCMESIESSAKDLDIVVVDVSNLNNSLFFLGEATQKFKNNNFLLLEQKENNGFAVACNLGIKTAIKNHPDSFIWILNNDTVINHETLPNLLDCFYKNEGNKIAFIGSLILDYSNHDLIQYAGGEIDQKWAILKVCQEGNKLSNTVLPDEIFTEWIIGASMFFHSSIIHEIGLMPEDYFLYYEDIEWSLKAIRKGHRNIVYTRSHVYHKQGSSTGLEYSTGQRFNPITAKYYYINYLKFITRNFPEKINTARIMVFKKIIGQLLRLNIRHSALIFETLISHLIKPGNKD